MCFVWGSVMFLVLGFFVKYTAINCFLEDSDDPEKDLLLSSGPEKD